MPILHEKPTRINERVPNPSKRNTRNYPIIKFDLNVVIKLTKKRIFKYTLIRYMCHVKRYRGPISQFFKKHKTEVNDLQSQKVLAKNQLSAGKEISGR